MNQEEVIIKEEKNTVPPEIKKFNWGAFLLNWIWGLKHGVFISLLVFVPMIGFIVSLILGFKGNEWAWKKSKYDSVEQFLKSQKRWGIAGLIIWSLLIAIFCVGFYYNYSSSTKVAINILNQNNKVVEYMGEQIYKDSYSGSFSYSGSNGVTKVKTDFRAKGSKRAGKVQLSARIIEGKTYIDKLIIYSSEGKYVIEDNGKEDDFFKTN